MKLDHDAQTLKTERALKIRYILIIIIYSTITILIAINPYYYVLGLFLVYLLFEFEWFLIDYYKIIKLSGKYLIKIKEEKPIRKYFDGYYISDKFTHFYIKTRFLKYKLIESVNHKYLNYFKLMSGVNQK